jgi:hypothetical protein
MAISYTRNAAQPVRASAQNLCSYQVPSNPSAHTDDFTCQRLTAFNAVTAA